MIFRSNRASSYKLAPQLKFYDSMNASWQPFYMFSHFENLRSDYCNTDTDGLRFNYYNGKFNSIFDEVHERESGIIIGNSTAFGEGTSSDSMTISNILSESTYRKYYNLCIRGFNGYQEIILFLNVFKRLKRLKEIVIITGINDAILPEYIKSYSTKISPIYGLDQFKQSMVKTTSGWKIRILKNILSPFLPNRAWNKMNKLNFFDELLKSNPSKNYNIDYNEIIFNSISNNLAIWKMIASSLKINIKIFLQPICKWTKKKLTTEEEIILKDEIKNKKIKKIFEIADLEKYKIMNNIFSDLCYKNDLFYFDLNQIIKNSEHENKWLFNGNFHISDLGTKIFVNEIIKR